MVAQLVFQLTLQAALQRPIAQRFAIGHKELFVRPHADGGAVNENEQGIPEVVLLDALTPKEILAVNRLSLPVIGEYDAFVLAVVFGGIFSLVLTLLAKQINASGEFLSVNVDVELVEPLDIFPLWVLAILFKGVNEARHGRIE